jgi:hypothetical protein
MTVAWTARNVKAKYLLCTQEESDGKHLKWNGRTIGAILREQFT